MSVPILLGSLIRGSSQQADSAVKSQSSPLERQAAFKAAVVLHNTTISAAVRSFGVSYTHFTLVLAGKRKASPRLEQKIAAFIANAQLNQASAPSAECDL